MVADLSNAAALAQKLSQLVQSGDWLLLRGPLGAGKTSFARALLAGLGHEGEVPSPTFTLIQSYDAGLAFPVWHVDLYRLDQPEEIRQLGLEDAGAEVLMMIEWPERLPEALAACSENALLIDFAPAGDQREMTFYGNATWRARLKDMC